MDYKLTNAVMYAKVEKFYPIDQFWIILNKKKGSAQLILVDNNGKIAPLKKETPNKFTLEFDEEGMLFYMDGERKVIFGDDEPEIIEDVSPSIIEDIKKKNKDKFERLKKRLSDLKSKVIDFFSNETI